MIICSDCRFFESDDDTFSDGGKCHRYPPTVNVVIDRDGYTHRYYPVPKVLSDNFCGEGKPRADAQAEQRGGDDGEQNATRFQIEAARVLADAAYEDAMQTGDGEGAYDAYLYTVNAYMNGELTCTCRDMHPDDEAEACEVCRAEARVRGREREDRLPF